MYQVVNVGSGCGQVGTVVASDTRGPLFESSRRQNLTMNTFNITEKTKIKKEVVTILPCDHTLAGSNILS